MIVIWIKRGGFCNQLFQLKKLDEIAPNATVVAFNFIYKEFISEKFKIININIKNKYINHLFYIFYIKILSKFINIINDKNDICKKINILDGYWQKPVNSFSDIVVNKVVDSIFKEYNSVAIHIRLNDYITWNVDGLEDVSLPIKYYQDATEYIRKKLNNPFFIIFSDDVIQASKLLNAININYIVIAGNEIEDLKLLGSCNHFILSPSTFSYLGAFLVYKKDKIILAPKYWIGHKHKYWIPENFIDERITYIEY